jgi:hypothetical protein
VWSVEFGVWSKGKGALASGSRPRPRPYEIIRVPPAMAIAGDGFGRGKDPRKDSGKHEANRKTPDGIRLRR